LNSIRPSRDFDRRTHSPSGLSPGRNGFEALADLDGAHGVQLVYIDMLELQHKAQPVVRVPAERQCGDLLPATIDPAGEALRNAGNDVAVEIDCAVASRDFPRADAAAPDAEWMIDFGSPPRGSCDIVRVGLTGQYPAALDIASVEVESGCRQARQFRLGYAVW
jgi:hypothetical protein